LRNPRPARREFHSQRHDDGGRHPP
jgi:hypothetical protein